MSEQATTEQKKAWVVISNSYEYDDERYYATEGYDAPRKVFLRESAAREEAKKLNLAFYADEDLQDFYRETEEFFWNMDQETKELLQKAFEKVLGTDETWKEHFEGERTERLLDLKEMQEVGGAIAVMFQKLSKEEQNELVGKLPKVYHTIEVTVV